MQAGLHRGQGTVLPGPRRADQPRPLGAQRRLARRGHHAAVAAALQRHPRPRPPPGRQGRPVQAARLQSPARGAVPAVPRHRGVDVALAAYLDLTGQADAARASRSTGARFLVENYDPLGALSYWRSGELGRVLAGVAAHGGRDRLVRAGRPAAVRADVPADGLAAGHRPLARQAAVRDPAAQPRYRAGRAAPDRRSGPGRRRRSGPGPRRAPGGTGHDTKERNA